MSLIRKIIDITSGLIITIVGFLLMDLVSWFARPDRPFGLFSSIFLQWEYPIIGSYCCIAIFYLLKSGAKIFSYDFKKSDSSIEMFSSFGWMIATPLFIINITFSMAIGLVTFILVFLVGFLIAVKMLIEWVSKNTVIIKIGQYFHHFFLYGMTQQSYCEKCDCFRWSEIKDEVRVCGLCGTGIKKENESFVAYFDKWM